MNKVIILGFKKQLTAYMYKYTRDLINVIVKVRNSKLSEDGAQWLIDLVADHNIGNFTDKKVWIDHLLELI